MKGVRGIIRIAQHKQKGVKISRVEWRPRPDGAPLWQFTDTFDIDPLLFLVIYFHPRVGAECGIAYHCQWFGGNQVQGDAQNAFKK